MSKDFDIKIDTSALRKLHDNLEGLTGRAATRVRQNAAKAGERAVMKQLKADAPVQSGWLRDRMRLSKPKNWPSGTWVGIKLEYYWRFLDQGIAGKGRSSKWVGWVEKSVSRARNRAFWSFAKIMKRGIEREMKK